MDKCKASGPDDFEQMSDDDKDDFVRLSNLAASKDLHKNKDPFEFPDSPLMAAEGGASAAYRTESQGSDAPWLIQQQQQQQSQQLQPQQPQLKTPAAVSTESIVSASLPANPIALQPQQQHDEDSDKDHNIGTSINFADLACLLFQLAMFNTMIVAIPSNEDYLYFTS